VRKVPVPGTNIPTVLEQFRVATIIVEIERLLKCELTDFSQDTSRNQLRVLDDNSMWSVRDHGHRRVDR
jgi:hypothetical protein